MNITNYKTGFTLAAQTLINQIMFTTVSYLGLDKPTIIATFLTNGVITYDFLKDGVYQVDQMILSVLPGPTGYYTTLGKIYRNTIEVTDYETMLVDVALTKDSLKIIVITDIERCYQSLLKKLLDDKLYRKCTTTPYEKEITDLLQMALSSIKFSAELGLVYQAQRIIESIKSSCDICNLTGTGVGSTYNANCGCNA